MDKKSLEITVGVFIAIGILAMLMLAMKVSNLASFESGEGYTILAKFENVGGLKPRAPVMMAGVKIGQVKHLELDKQNFEAVVTMEINQNFNNLPQDTSASIFTAGLLGEQYVALDPGGEEKILKEGDAVSLTQSAIVLEQVIGQVLFSKAAGDE